MKIFLTVIFYAVVVFDCFMVTPFGALWMFKNMDEGKPVYGAIIAFLATPVALIIGSFLGIVF